MYCHIDSRSNATPSPIRITWQENDAEVSPIAIQRNDTGNYIILVVH